MAAKKKKKDLKAQRARKQMIFVGVGAVVLLLILVVTVPKMLKGGSSNGPVYHAFPGQSQTASTSTGTGDAAATPVLETGTADTTLPDRDAQPQASDGQLMSFELFASKDPFAPQMQEKPEDSSTEPKTDGDPGGGAEEPAPTSAVISVNGVEETVEVGNEFPVSDPAFVLVSAKKSSVEIGIAGGSLASGGETVTLRLGKTLTLVNTVDGTEYKLRLVPPA
jgi:hypothetical protein